MSSLRQITYPKVTADGVVKPIPQSKEVFYEIDEGIVVGVSWDRLDETV